MRLSDEQRQIVEDNHNLIYWYCNLKNLDLEEWYDLLCIELCFTVMKYDPEKGSLSNYFKLRADNLTYKEYAKTKLQKRANNGIFELTDANMTPSLDDIQEAVELEEVFNVENGMILKMKAQGYTQHEIAEFFGVSQSHISKMLRKLKKEYYENAR